MESEKLAKIQQAGIPKKFWYTETTRKDIFEKYKNTSCFFWGEVGTGKSVLAAAIAKDYIARNGKVKWINYPEFIKMIKSEINQGETGWSNATWQEEQITEFKGVLVIDDLGAEYLTDFVKEVTYRLLNKRELSVLPVIITSNYNLNEIDAFIDRRISSRIIGMCEVIQLAGKDQRMATEPYKFPDPEKEETPTVREPMPDECRKELEKLFDKTKKLSRSAGTGT